VDPTRLSAEALRRMLADLRAGSDAAIGTYLYKGLRVQVSRHRSTGTERTARLYRARRGRGLCVRCGARVTRKNPSTGLLYRLGEAHRKAVDGVSPSGG
jgi:hypothetical protein